MTEQEKLKCLETCLQYEMKRQGSDLKVKVTKEEDNYYHFAWYAEGTNPKEGCYMIMYDLWKESAIEDLFKQTYFISMFNGADNNFYRQTLSALDIRKLN